MKFVIPFLFCFSLFAQISLDDARWYLKPGGQKLSIDIDDLSSETVIVNPSMDWGIDALSKMKLAQKVKIAIIDGGIDIEHPEIEPFVEYSKDCIEGNIIPPDSADQDLDANGLKGDCVGWDFVDHDNRVEDLDGHGTHISGIMATILKDYSSWIKFLPIRAFPNKGEGNGKRIKALYDALDYSLKQKVQVILMSAGLPKSLAQIKLQEKIEEVVKAGISIVVAAGNSSQRASIWPCQMDGVICVGALKGNGEPAHFSNWGPQVDILAPGEQILSTIPTYLAPEFFNRKGYDYLSGTSQAAPFIAASAALLKSSYPEENQDQIYARLMKGADPGSDGFSQKGLFHLDKSLSVQVDEFVYPQVKLLNTVVIRDQKVSFKVWVKNYGAKSSQSNFLKIVCPKAKVSPSIIHLGPLKSSEQLEIEVQGYLDEELEYLNCDLQTRETSASLSLKILHPLPKASFSVEREQRDRIVYTGSSGAQSRLVTLKALKDEPASALYYVGSKEGLSFHSHEKELGIVANQEGCHQLRFWQIDLDLDYQKDILIESLCHDEYLLYEFLNQELKEIYPSAQYTPSLTLINYNDFKLVHNNSGEPLSFEFLEEGLGIPSTDPWDSPVTKKVQRFYRLEPKMIEGTWKYIPKVLEDLKSWQKDLKIPYQPEYYFLQRVGDQLLGKIDGKTAWVDLKTLKASWANLDHLLWGADEKQKLHRSEEDIFQALMTPYDYRGYILNQKSLRFRQEDKRDPLMKIMGSSLEEGGYQTVLRSFKNLWFIHFNQKGELLKKSYVPVERFDFVGGQELLSLVSEVSLESETLYIVDGSKISTGYIDIIREGSKLSYEVPNDCVTQLPVLIEGINYLPLACAKSDTEFELQFISLEH